MGTVTSATIRLQGIEMDILEERALSNIVSDYGFVNSGALRDFLLGHNRRDLWSKAQQLKPSHLGRPAKAAQPGHTPGTLPRVIPTSPPKESVMDIPPIAERWSTAAGATEHRDGHPVTYGDRAWSYVVHGEASPKKRTATKAKKIRELIEELIEFVDAEAEEVKALKEIEELRAKLRAAEAKLKPKSTAPKKAAAPSLKLDGPRAADVRAWAREQGLGVPDRGSIAAEIFDMYNEAHRG